MSKKKVVILIVSLVTAVVLASGAWLVYFLAVDLPKIREKEQQQKEYNEFYAQRLLDYATENEQYDDGEVDIAFLGDSLLAGHRLEDYYPEYLISNRAIGGETTHGLNARLQVSVLDLKPKVCVMLIGGNNPETMFEDYESMLISFKENMPDTKVVLVSHAPTSGPYWGLRNKRFAYNNTIIYLLAQKYNYEFVDIYTPMLDIATGEMGLEYSIDGAHFSQKGIQTVTTALKPVVDKLLAE